MNCWPPAIVRSGVAVHSPYTNWGKLSVFKFDDGVKLWFLGRVLYWLMPILLVALAALCGLKLSRSGICWRPFLRRHFPGIAIALGLAVCCMSMLPPRMRVQFDETNLVMTSEIMH